jgi:ferrochelatase
MNIAVLIINMGGPDSLDAVEPYLYNIFKDPDIIDVPFPGIIRQWFVRWLAKKRGPESCRIYEKIGGKTPLNDITMQQAVQLQRVLNNSKDTRFSVVPAMRYWHPLIEDVWQKISQQEFKKLVIVCLYPFYSSTTTGSIEKLIRRLNKDNRFDATDIFIVNRFGGQPKFIKAISEQILNQIQTHKEINYQHILFSTHSIPMRRIEGGDPYRDEVEEAIQLVREQLSHVLNCHLSYQSKIGPVKWLSPSTADKIDELAAKNVTDLLVYPFGFVADNSETIYEIGMLYKDQAVLRGIKNYQRIDALNTDPIFIDMLKDLVLEKVAGG